MYLQGTVSHLGYLNTLKN